MPNARTSPPCSRLQASACQSRARDSTQYGPRGPNSSCDQPSSYRRIALSTSSDTILLFEINISCRRWTSTLASSVITSEDATAASLPETMGLDLSLLSKQVAFGCYTPLFIRWPLLLCRPAGSHSREEKKGTRNIQ